MRHFSPPGTSRYLGPLVVLLAALCLSLPLSAQTERVLHSFDGAGGRNPTSRLLMDSQGNLYGTAPNGGHGLNRAGTVYKLDAAGHLSVLHTFTGGEDGAGPSGGLIMDTHGNLYGGTAGGGHYSKGTVYEISASGNEQVLHSFKGFPDDGDSPIGEIVMDDVGNIFGTTSTGGAHTHGSVYQLYPNQQERLVYSFQGGTTDGELPLAGLLLRPKGVVSSTLYGTTSRGGANGAGVIFAVGAYLGPEMVLHSFGGDDGSGPTASLIRDSMGNLYGTTAEGGDEGDGTAFKLDPSGHFSVLHTFSGPDGARPGAGLVLDSTQRERKPCSITLPDIRTGETQAQV